MKLPALPADKANHVIYGLVVAMSAAALATATGHQQSAANAALFAAVAAGVA